MEVLRNQEIAVMKEFEEISKSAIQDLDTGERGLIHFSFLRTRELMLLTLALCCLLAWAYCGALFPRFVHRPDCDPANARDNILVRS